MLPTDWVLLSFLQGQPTFGGLEPTYHGWGTVVSITHCRGIWPLYTGVNGWFSFFCRAVASAVIVPDQIIEPSSEPYSAKRRHSPLPDDTAKRLRMGQDSIDNGQGIVRDISTPDRPSDRRRSGQMEERKRGQRLFGALLSTLSQSSSSTAQKRRTDIEKRQQAKLKLQAEEYDEEKKLRLEALMEVRRREQKKYNKQSVRFPMWNFGIARNELINIEHRCRSVIQTYWRKPDFFTHKPSLSWFVTAFSLPATIVNWLNQ